MRRVRFSWWIALPLLMIAILAYYFYFWIPLTERVEAAQATREVTERELAHAREMNAKMPDMKKEIEELKTQMEEMDIQILEATYQPEFLVYLQDVEGDHGVTISRIGYGGVQSMSGVRDAVPRELNYVDLSLGFSGTYQQVRSFIEEIEEGIWFTASQAYDFRAREMGIEGTYSFRVYFWPEIMDSVEPYLPEFPGTGRAEPFRPVRAW